MDSVAVVQGRIDTATVQAFASNMIRESAETPTIGKNNKIKTFSGIMKPIDIRSASEVQLRLLPTIGSVTAKKIIMYRRAQMFEHTEDLMRVKGIGVKRFQKMQGYLLEF
jgi:DNA uptake protein ComE-like DNA-binding protein